VLDKANIPKPFLMVKPDGIRYLTELERALLERGLVIKEIYHVHDWATAARAIYEPQLLSCGREFYVDFEVHVWLNCFLFGNRALVFVLEATNEEKDLDLLAHIVREARDYFRDLIPESRNGTFVIAVNLDKLAESAYQGAGKEGVLGILTPSGFSPLNGFASVAGRWSVYYFKYVHAPDNSKELAREWNILLRLGIISGKNNISPQDFQSLKLAYCSIPPTKFTDQREI